MQIFINREWDVYAELKKVKQAKACGPDGIPPKLVKEFVYELSIPLANLAILLLNLLGRQKFWVFGFRTT